LFNVVAAYGVRKLGSTDATGVEGSEDSTMYPAAASGYAGMQIQLEADQAIMRDRTLQGLDQGWGLCRYIPAVHHK
jgi:hypothetical protein